MSLPQNGRKYAKIDCLSNCRFQICAKILSFFPQHSFKIQNILFLLFISNITQGQQQRCPTVQSPCRYLYCEGLSLGCRLLFAFFKQDNKFFETKIAFIHDIILLQKNRDFLKFYLANYIENLVSQLININNYLINVYLRLLLVGLIFHLRFYFFVLGVHHRFSNRLQ